MSDNPELLRKQIHDVAKARGIFDNRNPSRLYCGIIIDHLVEVLGIPLEEFNTKIQEFTARNQGKKR